MRFTRTEAARRGVGPRKEGENRAGIAAAVAVVEVPRAGIVEIDGLLHEPKPEKAGVERNVAARVAGDGGDVMKTGTGCGCRAGHGRLGSLVDGRHDAGPICWPQGGAPRAPAQGWQEAACRIARPVIAIT